MNKDNNIYLDYNSTTPIDVRVLDSIMPYLRGDFANPDSNHYFGQRINKSLIKAREYIADSIFAEKHELIFTGGATEAINLAIKGAAESYANKGKHIITVSTEHKSVLATFKSLETKGYEASYLPVHPNGLVSLSDLKNAIRPDTILISVMYVNNETGVIQPIAEIAKITRANDILLMTDATQAVGKIPINVDELDVDLLCFSAHKMHAPKGIGVLYVRQRGNKVKLTPQVHGGGHEQGLRSGTLNVPGIIALAKACEIATAEMLINQTKITNLRNMLEEELLKLSNTTVNGDLHNRIFNTTNICFRGQDANVMIGRMKNVAVSNGAACSSAVVEPSHVLKAMGLSDADAFASLRFSLGKYNTLEEIKTVIQTIQRLN